MKYYSLKYNSLNEIETGTQYQSTGGYIGDIQRDILPFEGKIINQFELPIPTMMNKAKETSLLGVTFIPSWFLVIDDHFLNFLAKFNLSFQTWKIDIYHKKKKVENYNLFYIYETKQNQYIDFKKSSFYSKKIGDWDNSSIQKPVFVENYNEYLSKKEGLIKEKLMLLDSKVTLDLSKASEDMFRIVNAPPGGYFVSEKLKNAIEENGFTGMEFIEVSELDKVDVIY